MTRRRTHPPDVPDPSTGLTDEIRAWIVAKLAMRLGPTLVAKMANSEFGLNLDRLQVNRYNFDSPTGSRDTAEKWRVLFYAAREQWQSDLIEIPLANQHTRVQALQQAYDDAMKDGKREEACKIIEQISKEVGNANTNERVIKGRIAVTEQPEASIEELRNLLADRIAEAFENDPVQPNAPGSDLTQ